MALGSKNKADFISDLYKGCSAGMCVRDDTRGRSISVTSSTQQITTGWCEPTMSPLRCNPGGEPIPLKPPVTAFPPRGCEKRTQRVPGHAYRTADQKHRQPCRLNVGTRNSCVFFLIVFIVSTSWSRNQWSKRCGFHIGNASHLPRGSPHPYFTTIPRI